MMKKVTREAVVGTCGNMVGNEARGSLGGGEGTREMSLISRTNAAVADDDDARCSTENVSCGK